MEEPKQKFSVTLEARVPEFETERLFVINEEKHARQALEVAKSRHPIVSALGKVAAGAPKAKDWKHYLDTLQHYWHKLDRHEQEIIDGLVPVKFFVINNGPEIDETITIRVRVEHGAIHPTKEAPGRPSRIDADGQHVADADKLTEPLMPKITRFVRKGIKITAHEVTAQFSMLEGHGSADLVRQALYIEIHDDTRLTYEIRSKHMRGTQQGEVEF